MKTKTHPHLTAGLMAAGALVGLLVVAFGWLPWFGYILDICEAVQDVTIVSLIFTMRTITRGFGFYAD